MANKNRLPDVFNVEQLVKLFDAIDRPKVCIAAALTFFCGLRLSEVSNLQIEHIDLNSKRLKVVDAKNSRRNLSGYGKDRYVPIPDLMISPLKKWVDIIGGGKWLLPSHKSPDRPLRKKSLDAQFREALKRAGLLIPDYEIEFKTRINGKRRTIKVTRHKYHFHTLRHAYATYLLSKDVDLYTISNLLGHNQITTTQIYARISGTQKRKAIDAAFNTPLRSQIIPTLPQAMEDKVLEIKKLQLEVKKLELTRQPEAPTHQT